MGQIIFLLIIDGLKQWLIRGDPADPGRITLTGMVAMWRAHTAH